MTDKEKIEFIDDLLMRFEDFTHGQDGDDVTMSRKYLNEFRVKDELIKSDIKKFVEFLKLEGIVVEEEDKPQNFEFLYDVWSGKNPDGLL